MPTSTPMTLVRTPSQKSWLAGNWSLTVTDTRSGEAEKVDFDRPFATLGSAPHASVQITGDSILPIHLYIHRAEHGLFVIDLAKGLAEEESEHTYDGWWPEQMELTVGPYRISSPLSRSVPSRSLTLRPPQLEKDVDLGVLRIQFVDGRTAFGSLTRPLTLVGHERPCKIRVREFGESPSFAVYTQPDGGYWIVDLAGEGMLFSKSQSADFLAVQPGTVFGNKLARIRIERGPLTSNSWKVFTEHERRHSFGERPEITTNPSVLADDYGQDETVSLDNASGSAIHVQPTPRVPNKAGSSIAAGDQKLQSLVRDFDTLKTQTEEAQRSKDVTIKRLETEVARLNQQLRDVNEQLAEKDTALSTSNDKVSSLLAQLDDLQSQVTEHESKVTQSSSLLTERQSKLSELEAELARLRNDEENWKSFEIQLTNLQQEHEELLAERTRLGLDLERVSRENRQIKDELSAKTSEVISHLSELSQLRDGSNQLSSKLGNLATRVSQVIRLRDDASDRDVESLADQVENFVSMLDEERQQSAKLTETLKSELDELQQQYQQFRTDQQDLQAKREQELETLKQEHAKQRDEHAREREEWLTKIQQESARERDESVAKLQQEHSLERERWSGLETELAAARARLQELEKLATLEQSSEVTEVYSRLGLTPHVSGRWIDAQTDANSRIKTQSEQQLLRQTIDRLAYELETFRATAKSQAEVDALLAQTKQTHDQTLKEHLVQIENLKKLLLLQAKRGKELETKLATIQQSRSAETDLELNKLKTNLTQEMDVLKQTHGQELELLKTTLQRQSLDWTQAQKQIQQLEQTIEVRNREKAQFTKILSNAESMVKNLQLDLTHKTTQIEQLKMEYEGKIADLQHRLAQQAAPKLVAKPNLASPESARRETNPVLPLPGDGAEPLRLQPVGAKAPADAFETLASANELSEDWFDETLPPARGQTVSATKPQRLPVANAPVDEGPIVPMDLLLLPERKTESYREIDRMRNERRAHRGQLRSYATISVLIVALIVAMWFFWYGQ